jgi:quercetin dioxygenase-like cupin family protein
MTYAASPRPTFDEATHIPYQHVTRHLWGDEEAGRVADWIYVSNDAIHQLVFGLGPGASFRHSDAYRTVFAADELLYVLSGMMLIANPETGEVQRVEQGESAFFRRDTWHHVFARGGAPLRVLEYFAPPPSQGTSGAYARTKDNLTTPRYVRDDAMGAWPMGRHDLASKSSISVLRPSDLLWRLDGTANITPVGILASTEHLTVGTIELAAGEHTDDRMHGGELALYVLDGSLHVLAKARSERWFELSPRDGLYVPGGEPYRLYNLLDRPAVCLFGVAPRYDP